MIPEKTKTLLEKWLKLAMQANNSSQPTIEITRYLPRAPKLEFIGLCGQEPRGRILSIQPRNLCYAVTARFDTSSVITLLTLVLRKDQQKPAKEALREFPDAWNMRRDAGVSQVDMAKVVGVSLPTFAAMEKGKRLWSEQDIKKFMKRIQN